MAKRKFTSEEVLQAVLDSNSDVELDYSSDLDSNKSDDETRAIQNAGNDDDDDDIDDGSHARQDANQDNDSDTDGWSSASPSVLRTLCRVNCTGPHDTSQINCFSLLIITYIYVYIHMCAK